jgi:hypothetical protein
MAQPEQLPAGRQENITVILMFVFAGSPEKPAFLLNFYRLIKK